MADGCAYEKLTKPAHYIEKFIRETLKEVHRTRPAYAREQAKRPCAIDGCWNQSRARKMCDAHYSRWKKGQDLLKPLNRRRDGLSCEICGKPCGRQGGWGLCCNHYRAKRRWTIKRALVECLGNKCADCGGTFHLSAYDFHHLEGKDKNPAHLIAHGRIEDVASEIAKCVLLCANCHRARHWTVEKY